MPEGHTIHRLARDHTKLLAGHRLQVSSPQGRDPQGVRAAAAALTAATALDGRRLERIDAHGKHLLYRFEDDRTLHVHLGLFGRFRTRRAPLPEPRPTTRLRLQRGEEVAVDLAGAVASRLIAPPEEDALLARLGPDPLRPDADPDAAFARLHRRRIPVGAALLDQAVLAGVGNAYRAEALAAAGIDPHLPANHLDRPAFDRLWATITAQLQEGVRLNRIVTVPPRPGVPRSRVRRRDATLVYRRPTCMTCGGPVRREPLGGRELHWCPACQGTS